MHAFLFVGSSQEKRSESILQKLNQWKVGTFDQLELDYEASSVGISQIRELINRLKLKPYTSKFTVAIIRSADKLTIEAQQALLKTLEEPPPHARILLETANQETLLPTILSRCEIIDLGLIKQFSQSELIACYKTLRQLMEGSIGERFRIIDTIAKTKEETVSWIDCAIASARIAMVQNKISPILVRGLLMARVQIVSNVNPKVSLDNLFLSLSKPLNSVK